MDGSASPDTVPFIPQPIQLFVGTLAGVTAITRVWKVGDSRHCRLCAACRADHALGVCQVMTVHAVSSEEAPLYRSDTPA